MNSSVLMKECVVASHNPSRPSELPDKAYATSASKPLESDNPMFESIRTAYKYLSLDAAAR